jgi:hypothetical protein
MHRISIGADSGGAMPLFTRAFEDPHSGTSVHDPGGFLSLSSKRKG